MAARSSKTEHLFFRLRIPKPIGDIIVDQAWQARRSTNSQILVLLEKAIEWEGESLVVETPAGRGAKAAGTKQPSETKPIPGADLTELRKMMTRISKIIDGYEKGSTEA